ncbi:TPA: hypothetical protein ACPP64_001498 [Haemophilus influenzae]
MPASSLRISSSRLALAQPLALEIGHRCGKVIRVSEVLNFILDKHLNPSVIDEFVSNYRLQEEKEKQK